MKWNNWETFCWVEIVGGGERREIGGIVWGFFGGFVSAVFSVVLCELSISTVEMPALKLLKLLVNPNGVNLLGW